MWRKIATVRVVHVCFPQILATNIDFVPYWLSRLEIQFNNFSKKWTLVVFQSCEVCDKPCGRKCSGQLKSEDVVKNINKISFQQTCSVHLETWTGYVPIIQRYCDTTATMQSIIKIASVQNLRWTPRFANSSLDPRWTGGWFLFFFLLILLWDSFSLHLMCSEEWVVL